MKLSTTCIAVCLAIGWLSTVQAEETVMQPSATQESAVAEQKQLLGAAAGATGYVCGTGTNIPAGKYFSYLETNYAYCPGVTVHWTDLFDGATIMYQKDLQNTKSGLVISKARYVSYPQAPVEHYRFELAAPKERLRGCSTYTPSNWTYSEEIGAECGSFNSVVFHEVVTSDWEDYKGRSRLKLVSYNSVTKMTVKVEATGAGISDSFSQQYTETMGLPLWVYVDADSFNKTFKDYAQKNANFKVTVDAYIGSRYAYTKTFEKSGFEMLGIKHPTMTLSVNPVNVIEGDVVTRNWESQYADYCTSKTGDRLATSGSSVTAPVYSSNTYQISCTGLGGTVTSSVFVNVIPKPTMTLDVQPRQIQAGQKVTRYWSSQNASQCMSKTGVPLATSGAWETDPLYFSNIYQISCSGPGGTVTQSVDVTVVP
ncbi:hypothetical protein JVX91_18235 [Pseudomonas sp. PDNC002]|uniref:hypothetical protein n=1 Tax=Pseudomonas sp. PDNC002 TaxID=2811422 RepID=UPI001965198C|nr:hypothetical protein [Pseudomonas sp. PDNC002]QRY77534.1 hypothetical protein JVX91_18235 [Pseudomonas sp. PDNC002]